MKQISLFIPLLGTLLLSGCAGTSTEFECNATTSDTCMTMEQANENMNGIDNLMYMSSTSDSAGSVTITLTFQSGTDPDIAQVQVQNKLQLATPLLPQEVQQQGISVEKSSSSYLMVAGFVSDNPDTTQDDISDYVASNVKDTLSRLNGVGDVQLFGAQYAMRIWLDADLLNKYKLTPVDVINQLKVRVAAVGRQMGRGNGYLATIGAISPFVGLFGTVWGIMNSFIGIAQTQTTNLAVVAPGIAEALLATAIGLVAAIPAVVIYNVFARQIGGFKAMLGDVAAQVLLLQSRDLDLEASAAAHPVRVAQKLRAG